MHQIFGECWFLVKIVEIVEILEILERSEFGRLNDVVPAEEELKL